MSEVVEPEQSSASPSSPSASPSPPRTPSSRRSRQPRSPRAIWSLALLLVIALALLSRRYPLPGVFAEHTGDALYATAAYCTFALLRPVTAPLHLALAAFAAATAIECSQLLTWNWLVAARSTWLGAKLLGHGFQFSDLAAYAIGSCLPFALHAGITARRRLGRHEGEISDRRASRG